MLTLDHVTYNVDGKEILKDVCLDIEDRFVAITGPNGSGKSTLLRLIMGLISPTSGRIIFDGTDITDMPINERANMGISYAFQQPVVFKGLKVRDLLELAGKGRVSRRDACNILSEVGLCAEEYRDRELNGTLSGGELKRIEIAMAAARGSKLSLFDEPEAGIDLWSFQNLIQVFENLNRRTEGTIIIISHQERILDIADKIIYLKDGSVVRYAPRSEVMELLETGKQERSCSAMGENETCTVLEEKFNAEFGGLRNE